MKKILFISLLLFPVACTTPEPIPPDISAKINAVPVEQLQVNALIEHQRCPHARYASFSARTKCRHEVRRELAARELMKEKK